MYRLFSILVFFSFITIVLAQNSDSVGDNKRYFNYPKAYQTWKSTFVAALSVTRLPTEIVEEEINTSPVIGIDYRLGLPLKSSIYIGFSSNYISHLGYATINKSLINNKFSLSIGGSYAMWFGHLNMTSIKLKSYGGILTPNLSMGYDFRKFIVTMSLGVNYGFMRTYADDQLLGKFKQPHSLYFCKISIEQPLWNNHSVILSIKSNYATFYYQSWLSYSTIDTYLYYPEFSFGFIF